MSLTELIANLEAATEGSRELDGEIALTEGWTFQKMKGDAKPYWRKPGTVYYYMRADGPPRYTTSLDAALTGENIIDVRYVGGNQWMATHRDVAHNREFTGRGCTEALARRIAALKARATP